jgi:hypothetical protein
LAHSAFTDLAIFLPRLTARVRAIAVLSNILS